MSKESTKVPGSQRQKQKIQTRNHIIETAIDQFAKNGLAATRTSDIAAAAKVSHGTIFAHFPTREALLDEVIEEFGIRITRRLHELADGNCGMREVLEAHLKGIEEYESFYTRLISEAPILPESARNALIMIQSAISFHMIQIAEHEISEGKIIEMPFDLMFNTWIGLVHHYLTNKDLFSNGESVTERHGHRLAEHYLKLISKKEMK
ncbi:MAG: TetR/AcrR family transcriptional regulator [Bacillota bacterium]